MNKPKRILNVLPSKSPETDWGEREAIAAGGLFDRGGRPPKAMSWVSDHTPIQHQGQTGACVGYATAYGVLWPQLIKAGLIKKNQMPSARFIWQSAKEVDVYNIRPTSFVDTSGTYLKTACQIVTKYGCLLEETLPMRPKICTLSEDELYAQASRLKAKSYHNLGVNPDRWRRWTSQVGPVLTRLVPDRQFHIGRRKILSDYQRDMETAGHAVVIVGYSPSGFIVRNSWGKSWGMGGYAVVDEDYAVAAFAESYGILI